MDNSRQPYEAPELEPLGSVDELTKGQGPGEPDGEGSLLPPSDVRLKEAFEPVDPDRVLAGVEQIALRREGAHIGPAPEDFAAAFGVGADERKISAVDMNGVALAAIKALKAQADAQAAEIAELQTTLRERTTR